MAYHAGRLPARSGCCRSCRSSGSRTLSAAPTSIRASSCVQAAVRSLLLAALALALARPVMSTGSSRQSVVYAVDVSHSVVEQVRSTTRRRRSTSSTPRSAPTHSRIVAFGARRGRRWTTRRRCATWPRRDPASSRRRLGQARGSDLEQRAAPGARRARAGPRAAHRAVHRRPRTAGRRARGAAAQLAADGIPVSVEPLARARLGDTWVDRSSCPIG